jgi:hypothetical protein
MSGEAGPQMSLLQVETATAVVIAGAMSIALELAVGRLRPAVARGSASVALGFSLLLLGAVLAVTRPGSALLSFWPLDDPAVRVFLRETVGFVGGTVLVVSGLVWRLAAASSADSIVETRRRLDEKTRELTSAQGVINCIVRSSVSGVPVPQRGGRAVPGPQGR